MKNLISMTDFVLKRLKVGDISTSKATECVNYANFLKQPLELWMFVPCDEEGNVLEDPKPEDYFDVNKPIDQYSEQDKKGLDAYYSPMMRFEQAKERCLFEGFEITEESFIHNLTHFYVEICGIKIMWNFNNKWVFYKGFKTIEDLVKYNLEITPTAQKQLGL